MGAAALTPIVVDLHGIKWTLYKVDGEHTIRDLDWAERLQYERPRDIRKIIKRMAEAGKLGQVVCATVAQTSGSLGGRTATEYYLTKAQALKVAAKSETKFADELLDQMIHVFLVVTGQLAQPEAPPAQLQPAAAAVPRWSGGDDPIEIVEQMLLAMKASRKAQRELEERQERLAEQQTELARTQTAQAAKVDRLLAAAQAAEVEAQRPLTSKVMMLPAFDEVRHEAVRIIRAHGAANKGRYQASFNRVYDYYRGMFHRDLKVQAKNRGISPAELATELGIWDALHAIAVKYLQPETMAALAAQRGVYHA